MSPWRIYWKWVSYLFQISFEFCPMFFWSQTDMNVNGSIHVNGVSVVTWGSAPTLIRRWLIDNDFLNSLAFVTFRGPLLFNRTNHNKVSRDHDLLQMFIFRFVFFFFHPEERNIDFIVSVWTWGVSVGLILRWKTFVLCIKNCGKMGIASAIMSSKPIAPLWTYCNKNRSQNVSMANILKMSVIFISNLFWVLSYVFLIADRYECKWQHSCQRSFCRYVRFSANSHPPVADRQRFPQ